MWKLAYLYNGGHLLHSNHDDNDKGTTRGCCCRSLSREHHSHAVQLNTRPHLENATHNKEPSVDQKRQFQKGGEYLRLEYKTHSAGQRIKRNKLNVYCLTSLTFVSNQS